MTSSRAVRRCRPTGTPISRRGFGALLAPLARRRARARRRVRDGCARVRARAARRARSSGSTRRRSTSRRRRPVRRTNCTFATDDAEALSFPYGDFDLVGCLRVLHHAQRPELVVAELARVTRPGGRILLADQLGDVDPMRSLEQDRFERARDPSHTRLLPDGGHPRLPRGERPRRGRQRDRPRAAGDGPLPRPGRARGRGARAGRADGAARLRGRDGLVRRPQALS